VGEIRARRARHTNTNYCTDVILGMSRPDDKHQK
jgi:hypothetical protein